MSDSSSADAQKVKRTWPKRLGLICLGLLAALIALVIALIVFLQSGPGRDFVEARIERLEFVGQSIEIDGLNGSVLGEFGVDRITIKGRDGPWLIAQDVQLTWTPRALLSKTLRVDTVRIGDLDILQRPVLVPNETPSEGDPAITDFDIQGIDLPDVGLSESLFGQAMALSANGQLRQGPKGGDAVLSARSDQGDKVETDLAWSPLLVLSGTADIDGAPRGLIASLLRLDPSQGITATVKTARQDTTVLAKIDTQDFANLTIARGQSSVAINGSIEASRLPLLARVAPYLGGTARIDAVLPLDESAPVSLIVRSPRVQLDANGQRDDDTLRLDRITLNAESPLDPLDLDNINVGRITAEGRGVIGDRYEFDGTVEATAVDYQDYKLDRLSGPVALTFSDGVLGFDTALNGRATQADTALADGARLLAKGTLNLSNRAIDLSQADINLPGLAVRGQGQIGYGAQTTAAFTARYDINTAVLRDGPSAKLTGRATVKQTAKGPVADISGRARDIANLPATVDPLINGGLDYTARVRFETGQVVVPRFTASRDGVDVSGKGRWQNGQLNSDIQYRIAQYAFASVSAETVAGTAVLSGPPRALGFKTDLTAAAFKAGAHNMSEADVSATGTYSPGTITLSAVLSGDSQQGRVDTQADVVLADGGWNVSALDGTLGTLRATGSLSGLGSDLGSIRADLLVSGTNDMIPAETIEAKVLMSDAQVDIDATLGGFAVGPLQDATVRVLAKGPRNAVSYQIDADGLTLIEDLERPLTSSVSGLIDLSEGTFGTDASFEAAIGELTVGGLAAVRQTDQGLDASVQATGLGGAFSLTLDPADAGELTFELDKISVAQVGRLIARPATEGSISGDGKFAIVADNIKGKARITLDDLRSPISDSDPITVAMDLSLIDEQLEIVFGATEGDLSGQARISGTVETGPKAPFLTYPPAVPLLGTANLRGEIGPIVELFLPPRTNVAGQIQTDVRFTVPSTPTGLQGRIALTEGVFEQGALGLELDDITVDIVLEGEVITVPRLTARGRDGGTLDGSGRMGLGQGTGSVDVKVEKLRVLSRREGQAVVSGTLDVSRTDALLRMGGTLRVTDADLNIARLPKPGLPTLDVYFGEQDTDEDTQSFASSATEIDVRIISDGRIKVRGRGLNASMNLDAAVRGAFDAPVVTGQMSIDRGRFDFLSKRFEFRESRVTLREDILQSSLSLEAVRQTSELTAVVAIGGTLERPEITLTSEPNLPEDEVLSRILFGRSPTQLSAIETARLAAAISQLSGGSGFDLFGTLENAIGLDTLEIGQNTTGQTQLTTGKYLSDKVYLELRTAAEGTPSVAVEWQVRDSVSVEAETVPNEGQRLSLQWKKDFD